MLCKSLILLTGPTATGKTEIALDLVGHLEKVEIVSVDSRQIYRQMDIGTAKPTKDQLLTCPHHFIDILQPGETYNAGDYGRAARATIGAIWQRNGLPLLVGGTGLYWQSVLDGFFTDSADYALVRRTLLERLEREGLDALYAELGALDPILQRRIQPADTQRIIRSLEVAVSGEKTLSQLQREGDEGQWSCRASMICLTRERSALYNRIDQRVEEMVIGGLVAEVDALLQCGNHRKSAALSTLGYAEIKEYLKDEMSLAEAKELIKQRTRQFAKRQLTWFRRDRRLRFLDIGVWGRSGIVERIIESWDRVRTRG